VKRLWFSALRERADVRSVVERLDMLTRPGDRHAVQQLEEVEIQGVEDRRGCPFLRGQVRPSVEYGLGLAENLVDVLFGSQFDVELLGIPFISERELIPQIAEAIVDGRGREHQHFGLHPFPNHLVHQLLVAGFTLLEGIVVAEVVGLVDHDQIVVAPIDTIEWRAEGLAVFTLQIGMAEHVIVEAVFGEDVRLEIPVVGQPVVGEFLGAEHEYGAVA
jgi:hypothetical protein